MAATCPRAGAPSSSILGTAWASYLGSLQKNPLRTKALTSAAISGLSDVIAQRLMRGSSSSSAKGWNAKRTLFLAVYGLIWNGPSAHYWQRFLETLFRGKSDVFTVIKKVLLDQSTYGPLCNILFMSYATLVLEGRTVKDLKTKVKRDYPLVQLNGWKVWPLAAVINYAFVPLQFRVLFVNCVALCWSIFLLLRARKPAGGPPRTPAPANADGAVTGQHAPPELRKLQ